VAPLTLVAFSGTNTRIDDNASSKATSLPLSDTINCPFDKYGVSLGTYTSEKQEPSEKTACITSLHKSHI
jgi:hypothetical protein